MHRAVEEVLVVLDQVPEEGRNILGGADLAEPYKSGLGAHRASRDVEGLGIDVAGGLALAVRGERLGEADE